LWLKGSRKCSTVIAVYSGQAPWNFLFFLNDIYQSKTFHNNNLLHRRPWRPLQSGQLRTSTSPSAGNPLAELRSVCTQILSLRQLRISVSLCYAFLGFILDGWTRLVQVHYVLARKGLASQESLYTMQDQVSIV